MIAFQSKTFIFIFILTIGHQLMAKDGEPDIKPNVVKSVILEEEPLKITNKPYLSNIKFKIEKNDDGLDHRSRLARKIFNELNQLAKESKDINRLQFNPDRILQFMMYGFLIVIGIYLVLFGFSMFRPLMVILSFYASYYSLLFTFVALELYNGALIGWQCTLFLGSLVLGLTLEILCKKYINTNYIVFGTSMSCAIVLIYVHFFVRFQAGSYDKSFFPIYIGLSFLFSLCSYFFLKRSIIVGTTFIGAVTLILNVGVVSLDISPFELKTDRKVDLLKIFQEYITIIFIVMAIGLCSQCILKNRTTNRFSKQDIDSF